MWIYLNKIYIFFNMRSGNKWSDLIDFEINFLNLVLFYIVVLFLFCFLFEYLYYWWLKVYISKIMKIFLWLLVGV